jgi:hypothetical protein
MHEKLAAGKFKIIRLNIAAAVSFIQFKLINSLRHFTGSHNIPIIKSDTFYTTDLSAFNYLHICLRIIVVINYRGLNPGG